MYTDAWAIDFYIVVAYRGEVSQISLFKTDRVSDKSQWDLSQKLFAPFSTFRIKAMKLQVRGPTASICDRFQWVLSQSRPPQATNFATDPTEIRHKSPFQERPRVMRLDRTFVTDLIGIRHKSRPD